METNTYKPLEVPEVVPGMAPVDFPEISDFLKGMRIKSGLFGFQKEDVYEKMQQLNSLYQTRIQQMREQNRGQLKQMKKQQQEELEEIRSKMRKDQEAAKEQMEQELARAKEEALKEAKKQSEEEVARCHRELAMIQEEMDRLIERLTLLKNKVNTVAEEK